MKRLLLIVGVAVLAFTAAFFAFNNYIYYQKQQGPKDVKPYHGTLTGEYVCLPHTNSSGPQTLECALGMKTATGEYYALDFNKLSNTPPLLKTGETFTATGEITPAQMLSSDHWKKYPIEGTLSVSEPIKKD